MRAFVSIAGPSATGAATGHDPAAPPHLTLAFLGEVVEERSGSLVSTVTAAVAPRPAFDLTITKYGAFPNPGHPRVVFLEVGDGAGPVTELATVTRRALERDGFDFDRRPFVPHLTVMRVRGPSDLERARSLLAAEPPGPPVRLRVTEVLVNSSRLDRVGATHTVIGRCPLAATPD